MAWLKRNLILVVGGAVALILLGASGFFLFSSYQRNNAVTQELEQAANEFTRLSQRAPSATDANIDAAKIEQERLASLVDKYREHLAPLGSYTNIDSAGFKFLLANTVVELNNLAESQGVKRPRDFGYTFDTQRTNVIFSSSELLPWTYQLLEIRRICEVIYGARVHSLLRILRASPTTNESPAVVLRGATISTNTTTRSVSTPYEVVFQGFSTELAQVLESFAQSPELFLVKNINIEQSPQGGGGTSGEATTNPYMSRYGITGAAGGQSATAAQALAQRYGQTPQSQQQLLADRYGVGGAGSRYGAARGGAAGRYGAARGGAAGRYGAGRGGAASRYGVGPQAPPQTVINPYLTGAASAASRKGPETVLDEQLLRFTLRIEAVRPLMAAK